jgi:ATP-binding cassette subfamily B multidrug efflux pump
MARRRAAWRAGMPAEKSKDFKPSARGCSAAAARARARRAVVCSRLSVTLSVLGPKILGNATNIIFEGIVGKQLPPG